MHDNTLPKTFRGYDVFDSHASQQKSTTCDANVFHLEYDVAYMQTFQESALQRSFIYRSEPPAAENQSR